MNMRTGVAFTATVLVGLALTACGSDGSGEGDAAGGEQGDEMSPEETEVAFAECMRDEGAEVADPGVDDGLEINLGDLTEEEFAAAVDECGELYPLLSDEPMDDETSFQLELEFAECMRDEGVDYPDPDPGDVAEMLPLDDVDEEVLDAAVEKCSEMVADLEADAA